MIDVATMRRRRLSRIHVDLHAADRIPRRVRLRIVLPAMMVVEMLICHSLGPLSLRSIRDDRGFHRRKVKPVGRFFANKRTTGLFITLPANSRR